MSVTDDFFKNPQKYLDTLDIASARELIDQMKEEIPSCIEVLRNFTFNQSSIDRLERKVVELSAGHRDGDYLLRTFGQWKKLTQSSVIADIFQNYRAYTEGDDSESTHHLLSTIALLEEAGTIDPSLFRQEEVAATICQMQSHLDTLKHEGEEELASALEKCQLILTHYLSSSPSPSDASSVEIRTPSPVLLTEMKFEALAKEDRITQVIRYIEEGELAKAYWPVQQGFISLDDLHVYLEKDVYEWMQLQKSFDPARSDIESMALSRTESGGKGLGWGYKSANLTILSNQADEISRRCKAARVAVPSFMPIGDFEMQRYIMKGYPGILEDWSCFVETFTTEERTLFRAGSLTLNDDSRAILSKIRSGINEVFAKRGYDTPALRQWLSQQNPEFVIVRSTGKEDSDTNSNAGGNASIPFVRPEPEAIAIAMSEVLTSYFGEKSILQRMAAGDASLFDKELFLPVLVQEMVGEPVGRVALEGEIPSSGVIFTVSGADPTASELSVGRGNNEGIVSSSVGTDRFLLSRDGFVTKAVREKGTRVTAGLTEEGGYECCIIENTDPILRMAPALSLGVAQDLKRMADYFSSEVYGKESPKPLDMEFSVLTPIGADKATIYLLQARPLIAVKKEKEPSYINYDSISGLNATRMAQGKTLIDGGAYVRRTDESALLVCDTINESLSRFLKSPPAIQSTIKTVIISKTAPVTSHEAVTLRARGIGILVIEDLESYEKVKRLHQEGKTLSIDLQRGVVVDDLDPGAITEGYTCYPIPLEYSITPSVEMTMLAHLSKMEEFQRNRAAPVVKDYLGKLDEESTQLINRLRAGRELPGLVEGSDLKTWKEALQTMAFGSVDEAKLAAALILDRVKKLTLSSKLKALPQTRLELFIVLEEAKKLIEGPVLGSVDKAPASLERLYPIRLLEACLFQKGDVLGGFSAIRCLEAIRDQKEIVSVAGGRIEEALEAERLLLRAPLVRVSRNLLQPNTSEIWKALIAASGTVSPRILADVNEGIMKLSRLEILTQWSNTRLEHLLQAAGITSTALLTPDKIHTLFQSMDNEFKLASEALENALKADEKVDILLTHMSAWSDPEHVRKQARYLMDSFQKEGFILDANLDHSLTNRYLSTTPLGKMALLQSSLQMVRAYDLLIKTVKSSTEYKSPIQQTKDVKRLLSQYYVMMEAVLSMAQSEGFFTLAPTITNSVEGSGISIEGYLSRVRYGYKQPLKEVFEEREISPGLINIGEGSLEIEEAEALLLPSSKFNVASATLGSETDYSYSTTWPVTLEDYFTLAHQNMEASIEALRSKQAIALDKLPKALQSQTQVLLDTLHRSSITSIKVENGQVQITLNVPLRQHAATLYLSYDLKKTPETSPVKMRMSVFGKDEESRWELMAGAVALVGEGLSTVKAAKPEISYDGSATGLCFELEVLGQNVAHQKATAEFLSQLNSLTMSVSNTSKYLKAVRNFSKAIQPATDLASDARSLAQGGFVLALELAYEKLLDRDFEQVKVLLSHLESLLADQPSLGNVEVEKGYFRGSKESTFARALNELKEKAAVAETEGLVLSEWQIFERDQYKSPKPPRHLLQAASREARAAPSFAREAVLTDADNILYVPIALKGNKAFMLELVEKNFRLYPYASDTLRADPDLAVLYAKSPYAEVSQIPPAVRSHESVVVALVEANGCHLEKVDAAFRSRADLARKALTNKGMALEFVPKEVLLADPSLLDLAVSQNGLALSVLSKEMISKELSQLALAQTPSAYRYVHPEIKEDPDIAFECLTKDIELSKSLPEKLKSDTSFILRVMESLNEEQMEVFFKALPLEMRRLEAISLKAVSINGLLLQILEASSITLEHAKAAAQQNIAVSQYIPSSYWDNEEFASLVLAKEGRLFFKCSARLQLSPGFAAIAAGQDPSILPMLPSSMQRDSHLVAKAWGKVA